MNREDKRRENEREKKLSSRERKSERTRLKLTRSREARPPSLVRSRDTMLMSMI